MFTILSLIAGKHATLIGKKFFDTYNLQCSQMVIVLHKQNEALHVSSINSVTLALKYVAICLEGFKHNNYQCGFII